MDVRYGSDRLLDGWVTRRALTAGMLLVVLSIADVVSTGLVLSAGGGEGNPVAAVLLGWKMIVLKVLGCGVFVWRAQSRATVDLVCIGFGLVGVYAATVALNLLAFQSLTWG